MPEQGLPALTVVLTKLHAGGKFGGDGYKVSGGLHGVGISVVNALSEWLDRRGAPRRPRLPPGVRRAACRTATCRSSATPAPRPGTTITFMPDGEIFEEIEWSRDTLVQRLRETAFLTRGLRITLTDEREGEWRQEFHYEGGIRDFVDHVNADRSPIHPHIAYFENEDEEGRGSVEVAMQWNGELRRVGLLVREQHQHARGRRAPLRLHGRADAHAQRRSPAPRACSRRRTPPLEGEDTREGLAAVISVKLREPQFEGQTKTKLGNPWVRGFVEKTVNAAARRVPRREPGRPQADPAEGGRGVAGAHRPRARRAR